jgi:tetratricopeptide (TPR) repeat protein
MRGKWSASNQLNVRAALLVITFIGTASAQDLPPVALQDPLSEAVARNNEAVRLSGEGREAEAEKLYLAALGDGYDADLVRAKIANNLAALYRRQDRYQDAERMFRCILQWRQKNLPAGSIEVAYALNNLGDIYRVEGRDWEARNLMETGLRSLQQFHMDAPGLPVLLSNLAVVLCRFHEFDKAEDMLRTAITCYDKRGETDIREYGVTLSNLGQVLETKNDLEAAAPLYEQAIGIFERLGVPARTDLAATLANAGALYQRLDRIEEARQAEQRASELLHPAGDAALRAQILRNLGNIVAAGHAPDSLPYFEASLAIQEKTFGADHLATVGLLLDYSSATLRAGNKSLSRKLSKRAIDLLAKLNSQSPDQMTVSLRDLRAAK